MYNLSLCTSKTRAFSWVKSDTLATVPAVGQEQLLTRAMRLLLGAPGIIGDDEELDQYLDHLDAAAAKFGAGIGFIWISSTQKFRTGRKRLEIWTNNKKTCYQIRSSDILRP